MKGLWPQGVAMPTRRGVLSRFFRRTLVCAAAGAVLLVALPAWASNNHCITADLGSGPVEVCDVHWSGGAPLYYISNSVPVAWRAEIISAEFVWKNNTRFNPGGGGIIFTNNPDLSSHIVWFGTIPLAWQFACSVEAAIACTQTAYNVLPTGGKHGFGGKSGHIADSDTVFNNAFRSRMTTTSLACTSNTGLDVRTVMLHEFGHWGYLGHTQLPTHALDIMWGNYTRCHRGAPRDHGSMTDLYIDAGFEGG